EPAAPQRLRSAASPHPRSRAVRGRRWLVSPTVNAFLERVASWPEEDQEELAEVAREIEARRKGIYRLSEAERQGIEKGLRAMRKGEYASDERVAAILNAARSSRK